MLHIYPGISACACVLAINLGCVTRRGFCTLCLILLVMMTKLYTENCYENVKATPTLCSFNTKLETPISLIIFILLLLL